MFRRVHIAAKGISPWDRIVALYRIVLYCMTESRSQLWWNLYLSLGGQGGQGGVGGGGERGHVHFFPTAASSQMRAHVEYATQDSSFRSHSITLTLRGRGAAPGGSIVINEQQ